MLNTLAISTRDAFGEEILSLANEFPNLYIIDCDVGRSTKTVSFARQYPTRYINVGAAEQNAAGVAAGLATMGKIPIISTYAVFGSMRMLEQIRQSICYPNLNVKIACSHGGLTPGNDGATHQGIEDMGIVSTIPNMTVIMPADYYSARKLIREAVNKQGPVYLRFTRDPVPVIYSERDTFEIGKGNLVRDGDNITIMAIGDTLSIALKACEELAKYDITARVVDMHTLKPIDKEMVTDCIYKTKYIITVEDHTIINGLGSAVSSICAEIGVGRVAKVGIPDRFGESGKYEELLYLNNITVTEVVKKALQMLEKI